jgi:hypothetical protein
MLYRPNLILGLVLLLLSACNKEPKKTEETKIVSKPVLLKGNITGASIPIIYLYSSEGFLDIGLNEGLIDSAILGPEGDFSLLFYSAKPDFYKIRLGKDVLLGSPQTDFFLEPGDSLIIRTDVSRPESSISVEGNNVLCHQFTVDELNFFARDLYQSTKESSLYDSKPVGAAQFNNGLKAERAKFFKSYMAGRYVHGEFERYYYKKNVYEHVVRSYKYMLLSELRKKAKTRVVFTDLNTFNTSQEVEMNADYLLFIKSYRDYLLHKAWGKVHFDLSVSPDSLFEKLGYIYVLNECKKEYKGKSLEMALFESRKLMPFFWHRPEFYNQIQEVNFLLPEPVSPAGNKIKTIVSRLAAWAPGKELKIDQVYSSEGSLTPASAFFVGEYMLYIVDDLKVLNELQKGSSIQKVIVLYLGNEEQDLESWKKEAIRNKSKDFRFAALFGEEAQRIKSSICLYIPVNVFQMKDLIISRPFIKMKEPENYEPINLRIID